MVESDDSDSAGPQKGFRLTSAGGEELDRWLRTPPDLETPPRDELVIKVLVALRVPGVDVRDVIQVNRRFLLESMQQYTRLKGESGDDIGLSLVLDAEIFRLEAVVRWLDVADARLRHLPPGSEFPPPPPAPRLAGRRLSAAR
jgi:hypothetical protein